MVTHTTPKYNCKGSSSDLQELMWDTYIPTNKMLIHIKKKKKKPFKKKKKRIKKRKIHDGRLERWIQDPWIISCIAIRIRSQIWTPAIT